MGKVAPSVKAAVKEAAKLGKFTIGELRAPGSSAREAVRLGYFKITTETLKTGRRGRPAFIYKITDRGRKLVKV